MRSLAALTLDLPLVVALQVLTISINGLMILAVLIGIGFYFGWMRGIRAILTIALFTVTAYLLCVQGGQTLITVVNRFYQNGPRIAAFALGRDYTVEPLLDPLITPDFAIPLFFRFVLFIALIAFGWFFNAKPKWYKPQPDTKNEPLSQILGGCIGGFIALLIVSGLTAFWIDLVNSGAAFGGWIATVFYALPDVTPFVPTLIVVFFLLLGFILVFNLPKLWKA